MNPSSLGIDIWLRRAKGSAVQRQKDMNRIALAMSSVKPINCPAANCSMMRLAEPPLKNNYGVRQQITCS